MSAAAFTSRFEPWIQRCTHRLTATTTSTLNALRITKYVAREVYRREHLQPPKLDQWPQARSELYSYLKWDYIRGMRREDWLRVGVVGVELVGFFCIGEVVGRRNLVGYAL